VILLRFVADVQDVPRMKTMFCEGLAARIAIEICEPLTQSTAKLGSITAAYTKVMARRARSTPSRPDRKNRRWTTGWRAGEPMAMSSYVQTAFFGGEISQSAQGRLDLPAYKISMNVCLNAHADRERRVDAAARHAARRADPRRRARAADPVRVRAELSLCDGIHRRVLRFTTGPALVMTNDAQV
jgi:hypothetical protein